MPNPFEVLTGFLDRFRDEVEGRESTELSQDIQDKLQRLARGSLPVNEQAGLFVLLEQNPKWIARLAEEVKGQRSKQNPKDRNSI